MTDNLEYITVNVGGAAYSGFLRVNVSYGAKKAVRAFGLTVTDNVYGNGTWQNDQWNFMPGTPVSITANGDLVLSGYVDSMEPSYDDKNYKVEIAGQSKSGDSVKAHVEHQTHEFINKTVLQIANELDQQGVGYSAGQNAKLEPLALFRSIPGESVFSSLDRASAMQHLLLIGQPDGTVKIEKGGNTRVHPAFIEGKNILGASSKFDNGKQGKTYKVKGQHPYGSDLKQSIQITGLSTDSTQKRNIPKIIHSPTTLDSKKKADDLAKHHRDRQFGESITAAVTVQGWHDDNGVIWTPNTLVFVYSPMLKLSMDLLIDNVSLTQDASGSFAKIGLVHPKALDSKAGSGSGAQPQYNAPGD